jgi:cytochrome P450
MTGRSYIVTSPTLAAIVQRSSKTTSFYSVILEVTKRLVAFDKPTMDIIWQNVNREEGDEGIMPESHDMIASVLGPGPTLNNMSQVQLEIFSETIAQLIPEGEAVVELHAWVREQFVMSNAKAIYGPENLFAMHPELVKDFWDFEEGMIPLLVDFWPAITARKPHRAREKILDALTEFVEKGRYKKASTLIQQRVSINLKHGLTPKMAGHGELIMLFAIVGNAVPTTFWLLANLFSRPELLAEVRQEIGKAVVTTESGGGEEEMRTIHVEKLKSVAPVLLSCYRETLRMVANLSSVRWVLSDTMIADRYLLKKDSIVQIASGVIHADEDIWGSDVAEFNPRRFITTTPEVSFSGPTTEKSATAPLPKNVPSAAFRAFGGGSVICPGRHFAQSEIVGFAAAVLMGFDFEKPGGGTFELPERDNSKIPFAVMKPTRECKVAISRRKGLEKVRWELEL